MFQRSEYQYSHGRKAVLRNTHSGSGINMVSKILADEIMKIATKAELHEAWALMKQRSTQLEILAGFQFRVGDKASWYSNRTFKDVVGTITRINQKSISIDCGKDGKWKVSSSMLKKVTT